MDINNKDLQEALINGAIRVQPEEMMDALNQGADPFIKNDMGVSGLSSFLENSKELREMYGQSFAQADPKSLMGRMNGVFNNMLSKHVSQESRDDFVNVLRETQEKYMVSERALSLLKQKADQEGKKLSSTTTSHLSNKINSNKALLECLTSSPAFSSLNNDETMENIKYHQDYIERVASFETSFYDINDSGMVQVKVPKQTKQTAIPPTATATMPLKLNKSSIQSFRAKNAVPMNTKPSSSFSPD